MKVKKPSRKQSNASGGTELNYCIVKSPVDDLMLVADASALIGVYFAGGEDIAAAAKQWKRDAQHPILCLAAKQLQEYFAGEREAFSVPLRLAGTDFQQRIWREIARIPYGQTLTYSEIAKRAGAPHAIRAAGTSTGRNPAAIFVPCHRVVGKNGSLGGFGGGLDRKRFLLGLEQPGLHPDSARRGVEPG
jgi:methylated-DNA-[protein]-cysteine S-methyltransferase